MSGSGGARECVAEPVEDDLGALYALHGGAAARQLVQRLTGARLGRIKERHKASEDKLGLVADDRVRVIRGDLIVDCYLR